jgi:23S rRNA pseudouridine2605 synthase
MLEAVGHPVRRLHRSRYGDLTLAGLAPGAWRPLTDDELGRLANAATSSSRKKRA